MIYSKRKKFLIFVDKRALLVFGVLFLLSSSTYGCKIMEAITNFGTSIGVSTGAINESQANSIKKSSKAVARSFQDFTPEQEYYIGRSLGAIIVSKYKPYTNKKANMYINLLGQTLARASDRPEIFGGYHFLILESDEINAFATPGGFIFVTKGMLRCCKNEDAVAATLAHEIAHVQFKHGLQAIKKSRITAALMALVLEGGKLYGSEALSKLTQNFGDSISDITKTMINNGYSRSFERQADMASIGILKRLGYNPNSLVDMLNVMQKRLKPGGLDFANTHPSPSNRIADIQSSIGKYTVDKTSGARKARFVKALGGI